MAKKQKKQEALSVSRLINEVLVAQLSIPFRQIVNDTTFSKYTGSKRPDILISEFEYDGTNDEQYIKNLVAYAEAKDDCKVEDKDWKDALKQGKIKAPKLGLPYFIVTNCKTTYFYNAKTLKQLTLNGIKSLVNSRTRLNYHLTLHTFAIAIFLLGQSRKSNCSVQLFLFFGRYSESYGNTAKTIVLINIFG